MTTFTKASIYKRAGQIFYSAAGETFLAQMRLVGGLGVGIPSYFEGCGKETPAGSGVIHLFNGAAAESGTAGSDVPSAALEFGTSKERLRSSDAILLTAGNRYILRRSDGSSLTGLGIFIVEFVPAAAADFFPVLVRLI
jgi:hypothetical protein